MAPSPRNEADHVSPSIPIELQSGAAYKMHTLWLNEDDFGENGASVSTTPPARSSSVQSSQTADDEPQRALLRAIATLQSGPSSEHNQALETLIGLSQAIGWRYAYSILQNRPQVEDALQDCYLTVYQSIHQLREPKAFWGWYKRIVVTRCLRLKEQPTLEISEADDAASGPDIDTKVDVQKAFAQLSSSDRTILGLREILDLSYDDIGAMLEVPLSTVKTRIRNARQRLHDLFTGKRQGGPKS